MKHCITIFFFLLLISVNALEYSVESLLPKDKLGGQIIHRDYYTLCYAEEFEQPAWVIYRINKKMIVGNAKRSNKFNSDPLVKNGSADDIDYLHSGYDRGHLLPAADMKFSQKAMEETFFYSNMSPQNLDFNRGIWQDLEEQVRSWVEQEGELIVITGPVLKSNLPVIGKNKVAIPEQFYKIAAKLNGTKNKIIAFLIPNRGSDISYSQFTVSVDKVEELTCLDFFSILPDKEEVRLEKSVDLKVWPLNQKSQTKQLKKQQVKVKKKPLSNIKKLSKTIKKMIGK